MAGHIGKTTNRDDDRIAAAIQAEREDMWGTMDGEVIAFNPETQTATVRPLYKKRLNGVATQLPDLEEVPVRFPRLGGFVMTTPVKAGQRVRLTPQMRNTENYHDGGAAYEAADTRSFSLSDMEAFLDGGESLSKPIPRFNSNNMEIRSEDGQFAFEMSEDGKFMQRGAQGNVYTIVAEALRRLANAQTVVTKGSSAGLYTHDQLGEVNALADLLDGMAL